MRSLNYIFCALFFFVCVNYSISQTDSSLVLSFNFNNHKIEEVNQKLVIKPVGVALADDRFGNKESAIYIFGHASSYLNLGTSSLLKPKAGTISIWANLHRRIYLGKGYDNNPFIFTKNSDNDDFYDAYIIGYEGRAGGHFGAAMTKDSTKEVVSYAVDESILDRWNHFAITFDNHHFSFYMNGKLQGSFVKDFETVYSKTDSVVVGILTSRKNERFSLGTFDDIQIFHRVLSPKEIESLYLAPNPNKTRAIVETVLKYLLILVLIALFSFLIVYNRRKKLKREEEKFIQKSKMSEMEMKVIKAQMNPHFIFNSLNTIQQFVIANQNDKAQFYLAKFSKLIRKLLESNVKDSITIEDEVDILTKYLEIEALRFNNVFTYQIEVDRKADISQTSIPHMMVQPFVENAIWHGLLPKSGEKHIQIHFTYLGNKTISCVIEDNGVGRKKTTTQPIVQKSSSLAISFIRQRLELMSKIKNVNLTLEVIDKVDDSNNSLGTKIIIILPIISRL